MKDLVIEQIMRLISRARTGSVEDQQFNSVRWQVVAAQMFSFKGGDPETKTFRKSLSTFRILPEDLAQLSDEELLQLYELVVRRFMFKCKGKQNAIAYSMCFIRHHFARFNRN